MNTQPLINNDPSIFQGDFSIGKSDWTPLRDIYIRDDIFTDNHLYLGNRGTGTTTLMAHMVIRALKLKAKGEYDRPIVVIDPYGTLTDMLLPHVPESLVAETRLYDFRDPERLPMMNIADPKLFSSAASLRSAMTNLCRSIWADKWPQEAPNAMGEMVSTIYDYNRNIDDHGGGALNVCDCLQMIYDTSFRYVVLSKVRDVFLLRWWYKWEQQNYSISTKNEVAWLLGLVMDKRSRAIFDRPSSDIDINEVLREKQVLFVTTSEREIEGSVAPVLGSLVINLIQDHISHWWGSSRSTKHNPAAPLLAVDGMEKLRGVDFKEWIWVIAKQSGALLLSATDLTTQNYTRPDGEYVDVSTDVIGWSRYYATFSSSKDIAETTKKIMLLPGVGIEDIVQQPPKRCYLQMVSNVDPFSLNVSEIGEGDPAIADKIRFFMPAYINRDRLPLQTDTEGRERAVARALEEHSEGNSNDKQL